MNQTIAVIGARNPTEEDARNAFEVGKAIAEAGATLICGGLGGVMEEAARGAKEAGGLTVGILPGTEKADANPYIDVAIVSGMGDARNTIVAGSGDACIAIGGRWGTLSEIALARIRNRPVITLGSWDLEGFEGEVVTADSPKDAVNKAQEKFES